MQANLFADVIQTIDVADPAYITYKAQAVGGTFRNTELRRSKGLDRISRPKRLRCED